MKLCMEICGAYSCLCPSKWMSKMQEAQHKRPYFDEDCKAQQSTSSNKDAFIASVSIIWDNSGTLSCVVPTERSVPPSFDCCLQSNTKIWGSRTIFFCTIQPLKMHTTKLVFSLCSNKLKYIVLCKKNACLVRQTTPKVGHGHTTCRDKIRALAKKKLSDLGPMPKNIRESGDRMPPRAWPTYARFTCGSPPTWCVLVQQWWRNGDNPFNSCKD